MPDTEVRTRESTLGTLPPLLPSATPACANCGTPLAGPYCANCGQHVADFHRSVWRFLSDFFDNTICWDNKLFLTLGPLFKQPGFLTHEFMVGRRVRYVHPLRLFLFTSAVCLTLLQYSRSMIQVNTHNGKDRKHKGVQVHLGDNAFPPPSPDPAPPAATPTEASPPAGPKEKAADKDTDDDNAVGDAIKRAVATGLDKANTGGEAQLGSAATKMEEASKKMDRAADKLTEAGGAERLSRAITEGVQRRLSWVALALLPVFALGLRSLYWRKDAYYFEHLIFSLHYHTFLLLFWTAYVGVQFVASWLPFHSVFETMARFALLLPPVYLYVALRCIYRDSPKRTVAKVLVLGSVHLLAIVIGVAAVGAAAYLSAT